jgi:hypothetical protein
MEMSATSTSAPHATHAFVQEVEAFRRLLDDSRAPFATKQARWSDIVAQASRLDPRDAGFASAGLALKDALCAWLDVRSAQERH